jgi:predicted metal-binding membrane protein
MSLSDPTPRHPFAWWRATSALGRARRNLLMCLVVLTCAAWAFTVHESLTMHVPIGAPLSGSMSADGMEDMEGMEGMAMGGMSAAGWSVGAALVFVAVWTVMMAAMMLPAAAPMILIFASAQARRNRIAAVPTWIFIAGYLLVWAAVGVIVYGLVQIGAAAPGYLGSMNRAIWGPLVLGVTLVGAGVYQFTPLKHVCLRHCRSPMAFVALHWHDGPLGAARMGIWHGAYCLGCCWALFAILVVAGIMSLGWMLLLTLLVFAEKVVPHGQRVSATIGVALIVFGLLVAGSIFFENWTISAAAKAGIARGMG